MDEIDVTARYDQNGKPYPELFLWKGQSYLVDSLGRRWVDGAGEHILAMVPGGRVFELLLVGEDGRWYLKPINPDRLTV